ncbi:MAG: HAD-IIIA family hydrolase [Deltaproteobacteria bacterium]|nr:HAD-IIIA family hydrolase [Deltaproteobacteria bacterium]MBW1953113.1 HAD-IIIA family hydrolase [Deltaproteobacteria bacterium]MBW1986395.1 HAD-IIIA family hydrolase [Deltaproteobacteria bacterium]MBW2133790.1 HAD-IIIA family hydrolase [Deltaproteobacteria bacterium]
MKPLEYPTAVWEQARHIRLLLLDVDGVLTDGRIIYTDSGQEIKFFHVRDGHGIKLAQRMGIEVALITGRHSEVVNHRARDLGITRIFQAVRDKIAILQELLELLKLEPQQVAAMGDDLVDLALFRRVGLAIAVADAVPEVQTAAHWVTSFPGGRGAVREVCELLLKAQGFWNQLID